MAATKRNSGSEMLGASEQMPATKKARNSTLSTRDLALIATFEITLETALESLKKMTPEARAMTRDRGTIARLHEAFLTAELRPQYLLNVIATVDKQRGTQLDSEDEEEDEKDEDDDDSSIKTAGSEAAMKNILEGSVSLGNAKSMSSPASSSITATTLTQGLDEQELFFRKLRHAYPNDMVTRRSANEVYDFASDFDLASYITRLTKQLDEILKISKSSPLLIADQEVRDTQNAVRLLRRAGTNKKYGQIQVAWLQMSLVECLEYEYTAYAMGEHSAGREPKRQSVWVKTWRRAQEDKDAAEHGEATTAFKFELLYGRRYKEICTLLSGASDVSHRGALLILLVMRMPGGGPVFSLVRKKLSNQSFRYLKFFFSEFRPQAARLARFLDPLVNRLINTGAIEKVSEIGAGMKALLPAESVGGS